MSGLAASAEAILLDATGRKSADDAVKWIAEGHELAEKADKREVLRALVEYNGGGAARSALERITREVLESNLDSAAVLFSLDQVRSPERFRRALDTLAWKSPNGRLDGMTPGSVLAAQRAEPDAIPALCAIAGISITKLEDWSDEHLPDAGDRDWKLNQVKAGLSVINRIVEGKDETSLPSAKPLRALELMFGDARPGGWEAVERMRRGGVPYEVLLAQREAGGGWLAHRNRTSGRVSSVLIDELCQRLDAQGIDYLRASSMGGQVSGSEIERICGTRTPGLVVRDGRQKPVAAVASSVARDGGTARSSGSRLLKLRTSKLPTLLLLVGPGWAERNETAELVEAFDGEVYTDESMDELTKTLTRRARATGS